MAKPGDAERPFNWDDEVGTRADAREPKKLHVVVDRAWRAYSGTDTTAAMRALFGGRFTHLRYFPKVKEGRVYVVPAGPLAKGAEEVKDHPSRKTIGFNILAGLAKFKLKRIKGTNMEFRVWPEPASRYGKAMVLDVNSLEPKLIKPRAPRQQKDEPNAER